MKTIVTILVLFLSVVIWYLSALPRHYHNAKKTGLPIYFSPVNQSNPVWLILAAVLGYSTLARILPRSLFERFKVTITGWEYHDKYSVNHRLGAVFVLVTPGGNTVYIADAEIAHAVLMRRKDCGRIEVAARRLQETMLWGVHRLTRYLSRDHGCVRSKFHCGTVIHLSVAPSWIQGYWLTFMADSLTMMSGSGIEGL